MKAKVNDGMARFVFSKEVVYGSVVRNAREGRRQVAEVGKGII